MGLNKAVTDTSQQALDFIAPDIQGRERLVLEGLFAHYRRHSYRWPTALELLSDMRSRGVLTPAADVNAVRPRLSDLYVAGRVLKGEKRKCAISGKVAETWRPTPAGQEEAARQMALRAREALRRR